MSAIYSDASKLACVPLGHIIYSRFSLSTLHPCVITSILKSYVGSLNLVKRQSLCLYNVDPISSPTLRYTDLRCETSSSAPLAVHYSYAKQLGAKHVWPWSSNPCFFGWSAVLGKKLLLFNVQVTATTLFGMNFVIAARHALVGSSWFL